MHLQYYSVGWIYALYHWVIPKYIAVCFTYDEFMVFFCPWIQKRLCMNLNQYLAGRRVRAWNWIASTERIWWQKHSIRTLFFFSKTFLSLKFSPSSAIFSHGLNHTILIIVNNNKPVYFRVRIICLVDT